jgi:hypothetical protein
VTKPPTGRRQLTLSEAAEQLQDFDERTRSDRGRRLVQIEQVRAAVLPPGQIATAGGDQAWWLVLEAEDAYIAGHFLAALVCAHAACERELAGRLGSRLEPVPTGSDRWGLGRLVAHAEAEKMLPPELVQMLFAVNESRKLLAHYRLPIIAASYEARHRELTRTMLPGLGPTLDELQTQDALVAVRAALMLLANNPLSQTPQ